VLRRVFGPKRAEVAGEWTKLHNEKLNDRYTTPDIFLMRIRRRIRWAGHVAHMGRGEVIYGILVEIPDGQRPLGRPRSRWDDNIKIDIQGVEWCMDWMIWLSMGTDDGHL
jgi:hypothetical protein